jgi:hypothetical protein
MLDRRHFLAATGQAALTAWHPGGGLTPPLARVCHTFDVREFGARADGRDDGAAIQATVDAAAAAAGSVDFPAGTYTFGAPLDLGRSGLVVRGHGIVRLRHTGAGPAVRVEGTSRAEGQLWNVQLENLIVEGGAGTTAGFRFRAAHHGRFVGLRVLRAGASSAVGFQTEFFVANYCESWVVSGNEGDPQGLPARGLCLAALGGVGTSFATVDSSFVNCIIEGCEEAGMILECAHNNLIRGGTLENCRTGTGLRVHADCTGNVIDGVYLEDNRVNVECHGASTHFIAVHSAGAMVTLGPGADGCRFHGGYFSGLGIEDGVSDVCLFGAAVGHLSDRARGTREYGCRDCTTGQPRPDRLGAGISIMSWNPAPLVSPWRDVGGGTNPSGYMRDLQGFVHLRGYLVGGGELPSRLFTLPQGYRPPYRERLLVLSGSGTGIVEVRTDGEVLLTAGSSVDVTLDGLRFGDGSF